MKRISAIVCAVVLAAACILMTGCGGKYSDSKYLGKWKATKAEYSGVEMDVEEILGGEFSFTLDAGGKVSMKVVDKDYSGKWEETDEGVIFDGDNKLNLVDKGGKLEMDYTGITLTFEKEE